MSVHDLAIPGRECGACTACCTELTITTDDMVKMSGVACEHCRIGGGCNIYATRPQLCREYYCMWRCLPDLDTDWRPDLSGVMMLHEPPVEGYNAPLSVKLMLIGSPEILETDRFAMLVGGFIDRGTPTFLNLPGKPGYFGQILLLNDDLKAAVAARHLGRLKALIMGIYAFLKAQPEKQMTEAELIASGQMRASGAA